MKRTPLFLVAVISVVACGGGRNRKAPIPSQNVATDSQWTGQNAARVEELFAGRFAGVVVTRIPGGISVRIRGGSTITGSNEPLYVIDGMPIDPGPGGALVGINPADIEKIEVLKDIGSTAMYGSRGANGVILIRTKRGNKPK
jgi:TonB-dependent starch-binding outer membrane protein SusC